MPKISKTTRTFAEPAEGACKTCREVHEHKCASPYCSNTGTISGSVAHACSGQAKWYCAACWFGNENPAAGPKDRAEKMQSAGEYLAQIKGKL